MRWRIAVFHQDEVPFDRSILGSFDPHMLELVEVSSSTVGSALADLLFVIGPDTAAPWYVALHDSPVSMPVFATVPESADQDVLSLTSRFATDFVIAPARPLEVQQRVARILGQPDRHVGSVHDQLIAEQGLQHFVGRDPAFLRVLAQLPVMARSNCPVFVTGETGTGKELCARAIHHLSRRREFPFLPVDCGALPDQLFENELFGHVRGAYTDAHREQRGLVAMADRGTLFLDEIDSLSPAAQAKLLRFLQERTYRPLGSDRFLQADVNVVAASNRDLEELVAAQKFRADLYFRLSVLRLHIIPLRERRDDIGLLAQHFLDTICREQGVAVKKLSLAAVAELSHQQWAGNVRELHNVMQRVFVLADGVHVLPAHIQLAQGRPEAGEEAAHDIGTFRMARARALHAFEQRYVVEMLKQHKGNVTQAARYAGQDRRAFGRLVKRHGIDRLRLTS